MTPAGRTVAGWLVSALLERGCDPTTARLPRPTVRIRPLTDREWAAFTAPLARLLVLPPRRPQPPRPPAGLRARLLPFPAARPA